MLWAALIPAALCAGLAGYLLVLNAGLRRGRERLEEQMENKTTARLDVPCPNAAAEALFQSVNRLLELRQDEMAQCRRMEEDLRRRIADLSHDLRTPLTSILGYLQLLEDPELDPARRGEYLAVLRDRAAALQGLITAFYDLSRLEGGQWSLEREAVDLVGVVRDQLAAVYGRLEEADLAPTVDIPDGPLSVWGDGHGIQRVVSNLLANVLDHGTPPVTVRLRREGDRAILRMANAAPAMTASEARRVFERSYTADRARSGQNSGLGLSIVQVLMERMEGQVSAGLEKGVFTVEAVWPVVREE